MRLAILVPSLVLLLPSLFACSRASDGASTSGPSASAVPQGTLLIGERITSPLVPLADIAKDPGRYADRMVATSGTVTSVCQEMGCWMEIQDASGQAHVRMHGHAFFVPKTASGHKARVQATVVKTKDEDCDEHARSDAQSVAKVELDATGVELD